MKLYKNGRTILFAIVIIFFIVLLLFSILPELTKSYSLGPNEYIYYDWKYHNESNISINVPAYYNCVWNNPIEETKHCSPIVEITNTGGNEVTIGKFNISSDFNIASTVTYYASTTTDNVDAVNIINWSCMNSSDNKYESDCTIQINRINWAGTFGGESPGEEVIQPGQTLGLKIQFDMGLNDGGTYNITFDENRASSTISIDPDIGVCQNISSAGYYNLNDSLDSTGSCIYITSPDVVLNCMNYDISFSSQFDGFGIRVDPSMDNITIKNCSDITAFSAGAPNAEGISFGSGANNIIVDNVHMSGSSNSMYMDCLVKTSNNNINLTGVRCITGSGTGIYFMSSTGINITNVTFGTTNSGRVLNGGLHISNTTNVNVTTMNLTFTNNNNNRPAFYLEQNSSAWVLHGSIYYRSSNTGNALIKFENNNDKDLNLTNVSWTNAGTAGETSFESDCNGFIHRKWFVESYVNDTSGNAISGANVTIKDINSNFLNWSLSNSSGYTPRGIYKQYSENATQKYYDTPFTFKGSKSGYPNGTTITNITTNRIIDTTNPVVITLGGDDVNMNQSFSSYLSGGINFSVSSLPAINLSANGNNGAGVTSYNITITLDEGTADLWIKANGNLDKAGGGSIALVNEKYSYSTSDNTVPSGTKTSLTTSYNKIVGNLASGTTVYLKFYLNVTSGTASGVYNNTLSFLANQTVV